MFRVVDPTGKSLEALRCIPCENDREQWARVITCRGDNVLVSELSWPLARRILPKLLARYGHTNGAFGLFCGQAVLI